MLRSNAFGVRFADVMNTCSLSWTTALAWRTAPGPSPWSTDDTPGGTKWFNSLMSSRP